MKALLFLISGLLFYPLMILGQAGSLDLTFGDGGKVTAPSGQGHAMCLQPDGKIILGGTLYDNGDFNFSVVRYNSDGSIDNTFGTNGQVTTDLGGSDFIESMALQADGRIVAAGFTETPLSHIALMRYNDNGAIDSSFGTNGTVITSIGQYAAAFAIVIQSDGKIVVAGYSSPIGTSYNNLTLVRYNANGSLDTSFAENGISTFNITGAFQYNALAIQPNGKLVAAGYFDAVQTFDDLVVVRYNENGSIDQNFGSQGKRFIDIANKNDIVKGMAIQPAGKIILCGSSSSVLFVARLTGQGDMDHSFFNQHGYVTIFLGNNCTALACAIQPDGKIVSAGSSVPNGDFEFDVVRLNTYGKPDYSFGKKGRVVTDFDGHNDEAFAVALQPDGKIIAGGYSDPGGDPLNHRFALARYIGVDSVEKLNTSADIYTAIVFPNPATDEFQINYNLVSDESVTLSLYDLSGRLIRNFMMNEAKLSGEHCEQLSFPALLPSGAYLLTLTKGITTERVTIVKE